MKIQPPVLGPILGYTTHDHARIWLRGDLQLSDGEARRAFAVAQVRPAKGRVKWSRPVVQKLMPHFDMTGVCVFDDLLPETDYLYRAGWYFSDAEWETTDIKTITDFWTDFEEIPFRTGSDDPSRSRSFIAGSCRYLLRLFGNTIFDDRGDKCFRSIGEQLRSGISTDALLMVGDQVYADDLNSLFPDQAIDQFLSRYRSVFSQPYLRSLMSRLPTYMILDDHEIEDNWPSKASKKDRITLYPAAIHSYQIYQASHSPLFGLDSEGYISGVPEHFWYCFTDGCVDCFVTDSRTERIWSGNPAGRRMMNEKQMNALLAWLDDGSGRVKLIVTSVPMFPDLQEENDDKWGGYQEERTRILDHIFTRKISKVVILSGDVHCSFTSELTCAEDPDFRVHSVISSSFFWPYPHMRESQFAMAADLQSAGARRYRVGSASEMHSEDNFARLNFSASGLDITYYARKGDQLGQTVSRKF